MFVCTHLGKGIKCPKCVLTPQSQKEWGVVIHVYIILPWGIIVRGIAVRSPLFYLPLLSSSYFFQLLLTPPSSPPSWGKGRWESLDTFASLVPFRPGGKLIIWLTHCSLNGWSFSLRHIAPEIPYWWALQVIFKSGLLPLPVLEILPNKSHRYKFRNYVIDP